MKTLENANRPQKNIIFDDAFLTICKLAGIFLLLIFISIIYVLISASFPSIKEFGFSFLTSSRWDPVQSQFGALSAITGTFLSSLLALIIALPISIGISYFISNLSINSKNKYFRFVIDCMAAVPSVVYGLWAFNNFGIGLFSSGLILAVMIIPILSSTLTDVFDTVSKHIRESGYSLGLTPLEIFYSIIIPGTKSSILSCILLGLARALGETMAVTFVIGNAKQLTFSLFQPATTISASIANEFSEASGSIYPAALLELGLILFLITFLFLMLSKCLSGRKGEYK